MSSISQRFNRTPTSVRPEHDVPVVGTPRRLEVVELVGQQYLRVATGRRHRQQGSPAMGSPLENDALTVERVRCAEVITARGRKGQLLGIAVVAVDPVDRHLPRLVDPGNEEGPAVRGPGTVSHGSVRGYRGRALGYSSRSVSSVTRRVVARGR